jgi:hypothetical protein
MGTFPVPELRRVILLRNILARSSCAAAKRDPGSFSQHGTLRCKK